MKKKIIKKKNFLDAVGWKPYCSRLGRRALGAGALGWALGRWAWALGLWAGRWALARRAGAQAAGVAAGAGARGTAWTCADGRAGRADARGRARQAGHGRAGARGRALARWAGERHGTARQERAAGRQGACETRGAGARGARPGRAWARLVHWLGQFEAHAASLGFDLGF